MKNIILSVVATIFSLTAIGQVPQYYDSWMFPEAIQQGCFSIPMMSMLPYSAPISTESYMYTSAYAQPYFTDSIISIKGIAILGYYQTLPNSSPDSQYYFQIRDSSLQNILASVRYDTLPCLFPYQYSTPPWSSYGNMFFEVLFDSSIFVNSSKFYATITCPKYISYVGTCCIETNIFAFFENPVCPTSERPQSLINNKWDSLPSVNPGNPNIPLITTLCIFPILDTLTYQGISELSNVNSDVEINIYPNPTENELNISSSIEITKVEILNVIGQVVCTKELKSKNTKIDISNLPNGNYITKIHTTKGVKTNKILVQ